MGTLPKYFYRIIQGRRVLSGCIYCQGAIFWTPGVISPNPKPGVFKCFHCGRMFLQDNDRLRLWPYKEYEHLKKYQKQRGWQ